RRLRGPERRGRRRRRVGGLAATHLRALLPCRLGAQLAWHRARARDRQARGRSRGRRGRGRERTGPRPPHPLRVPALRTTKGASRRPSHVTLSDADYVWICLSVFSDATRTECCVARFANVSFAACCAV